MWAAQTLGTFLYDFIMHKTYVAPFQIWSPVTDFILDLVLWIFGFGYLMGETIWQKHERSFHEDEHVV